jgi:putative endonuclease
MTNPTYTTFYTGMTNDLERRVYQHRHKLIDGFTSRYNITHLVYYEMTSDVHAAIAREKQVKDWSRAKKIALVESMNADWRDLADRWFAPPAPPDSSLRSE